MAMGGYSTELYESNPVFYMPEKWLLQQASRQTIWTNNSEHWNLEDAIQAAILQINFNPSLVLRIINTLTMDVEWESNNIQDFQHVKNDAVSISGIGIGA